jgi:hypothetical protein
LLFEEMKKSTASSWKRLPKQSKIEEGKPKSNALALIEKLEFV